MIIAGRCFRVGQERASIEDASRERRIRGYVTIRDSPLSLSLFPLPFLPCGEWLNDEQLVRACARDVARVPVTARSHKG